LHELWPKTRDEFLRLGDDFQFHTALDRAMQFIAATNAYIEKRAPWKLAKDPSPEAQARLRSSLATMAEALRLGSALLAPTMPATVDKIRAGLGLGKLAAWENELEWGSSLGGKKLGAVEILFPKPAK
jgi:methionyl-tRNA synthetase